MLYVMFCQEVASSQRSPRRKQGEMQLVKGVRLGGVIAVNLNSLAVYPSIQLILVFFFFFFFYWFNSILLCFRGCSNINFPIKP